MREQITVTVNGQEYMITQMGGQTGFRVGKKLVKILGPSLAALMAAGEEGWGMSSAIEAFADNIDMLDDETVNSLMSTVTKNNMGIKFDDEFAGNYGTLVQLLVEVIKANKFLDVFTVAQDALSAQ